MNRNPPLTPCLDNQKNLNYLNFLMFLIEVRCQGSDVRSLKPLKLEKSKQQLAKNKDQGIRMLHDLTTLTS
jgi:hypothetical protein